MYIWSYICAHCLIWKQIVAKRLKMWFGSDFHRKKNMDRYSAERMGVLGGGREIRFANDAFFMGMWKSWKKIEWQSVSESTIPGYLKGLEDIIKTSRSKKKNNLAYFVITIDNRQKSLNIHRNKYQSYIIRSFSLYYSLLSELYDAYPILVYI